MFVALLEEVSSRFSRKDLDSWKAPDTKGVLHLFSEITAGDPGNTVSGDSGIMSLNFLHPSIPPSTAKSLGFPSIQSRFLETRIGQDFILDCEQEEGLVTVICDTLKRYTIHSTFNEYLANAEDSGGAQKICWVLDFTPGYPCKHIISPELEECQGPALFCYNDGGTDFLSITCLVSKLT